MNRDRIDKAALISKILQIEGLTNEEKSTLMALINEEKSYGLVWEDSPEEVEENLRSHIPVLHEVTERALTDGGADAPNHILIEGDNLDALTALSYTHENSIDVIYIDPPYNTGNEDFIYNDKYVNTEDSYRHSKWLSFMSRRLYIAKRLLSDKGVIFISIDDNEQANLKILCDEVLGGRNFIGELILKTATDNNPSQINIEHEYMICFAKNKLEQSNWERTSKAAKLIIQKYKDLKSQELADEDIQKELRKWIKSNKESLPQVAHYNNVDEKGVYSSSSNSSNPHPGGYMYDILHPITGKPCPKPQNGWRWPFSTFQQYAISGEIEWGKDETTQPHVKKRIETSTEYLRSLIYEDNRGTTKALADMFDGNKVFDNPKPTTVLSRILDFSSSKDSIILDFFAGSGTTLHATIQLNAEDDGHRQCILINNNENGICENVTYERNKRVIQGYTTPQGQFVEGLHNNNLRYYKIDYTNRSHTHENRMALAQAMTELLQIKNGAYETPAFFGHLKVKPRYMRYFRGDNDVLVVYFPEIIPHLVNEIKEMSFNDKLKVYIAIDGNYPFADEFATVASKVDVVAIPSVYYHALKHVLPDASGEPIPDDAPDDEDAELLNEANKNDYQD